MPCTNGIQDLEQDLGILVDTLTEATEGSLDADVWYLSLSSMEVVLQMGWNVPPVEEIKKLNKICLKYKNQK